MFFHEFQGSHFILLVNMICIFDHHYKVLLRLLSVQHQAGFYPREFENIPARWQTE